METTVLARVVRRADAETLTWLVTASLLVAGSLHPRTASGLLAEVAGGLLALLPVVAIAALLAGALTLGHWSDRVSGWLAGSTPRAVVLASLVGAVTPVCGLAMVPLIVVLLRGGLPLAPVMAFWVSSPISDPGMIVLTVGIIGLPFAIAKLLAAFGVGLLAGTATALLPGVAGPGARLLRPGARAPGCEGHDTGIWAVTLASARLVLRWLALALVLESLLQRLVPDAWIAALFGDAGTASVPLAAIAGAPLYLDGYAALPLVRGLLDMGMSFGAALALMVSGAAVSLYAAAAVASIVRARVFGWYLALALTGACAAGYAAEWIRQAGAGPIHAGERPNRTDCQPGFFFQAVTTHAGQWVSCAISWNATPDMASWRPIPTETFDIPVHEVRRGYRSDAYFWRAKVALERAGLERSVLMQVFQRQSAVLCGIDETLAILKLCAGYYREPAHAYALFDRYIALKKTIRELYFSAHDKMLSAQKQKLDLEAELDAQWVSTARDLKVRTLRDGSHIRPWETVMTIEGPLHEFAHLETLYLGVLARRTKIATNVHRVVAAARGKPVFYFPARFDHWAVQGGDGYAASIGGADSVSTDAQGEWWGKRGAGTIPHCLIAACKGDTIQAAEIFAASFPDANLIALVDFENDCVNTSLAVAEHLGDRLWGVRLDTSGTMVDQSVIAQMGSFAPTGVNPQLVWNVRKALDAAGHPHVRIVVSGGFDADRIAKFEAEGVPADVYGVGSSLVVGNHDFTADVVMVEGTPCSKKGRHRQDNDDLRQIEL